uniref:Uncharacterized protein n=1 Tax=Oryzias latipes TaxID=8090 RepID=A0A3P9MG59_ORYLA
MSSTLSVPLLRPRSLPWLCFKVESGVEPLSRLALESGVAELMEATLPRAGSGLAALWMEESAFQINGKLRFGAFAKRSSTVLVFAVGVLRFDVREQRGLVQEDLRTVDALQVGAVGQLRVPG